MNSSRKTLLSIAVICGALLGAALYFQIVEEISPCPLCIIQRYLFAAVGLICIVLFILPQPIIRWGAAFNALVALCGAGTAGWHWWVQEHPNLSCGRDPLEATLNAAPMAKLFPLLFQADGFCTAPYPPLLGLTFPQWALIWFLLLTIVLIRLASRGR